MCDKTKAINFINQYRNNILQNDSRVLIKEFNRNLASFNYIVFVPHITTNDETAFILGFTNSMVENCDFKDSDSHQNLMKSIKSSPRFFKISKEEELTDVVYLNTTDVETLPFKKVEWSELINAPKIDDADYDLIQKPFLSYFRLDDSMHYDDGESFSFSDYFNEESNKPADLELRNVWRDVDRDEKYGEIQTLVFWKEQFIGWITRNGRYLDVLYASTVNVEQWKEMMDHIYKSSGYVHSPSMQGFHVYDMTTTDPDDVVSVPGVTQKNYED